MDCFGNSIALTTERFEHILSHPEMLGMEREIRNTLVAPSLVRCSRTDDQARLFYRFFPKTVLGGKWLCVVVKYRNGGAFVITAYLTDQPKAGEDLWPKK